MSGCSDKKTSNKHMKEHGNPINMMLSDKAVVLGPNLLSSRLLMTIGFGGSGQSECCR